MTPHKRIESGEIPPPRPFLQLLKISTSMCGPHIYLPVSRILSPKKEVRPSVSRALNALTQAVNAMS
jgi:hypothetical protein